MSRQRFTRELRVTIVSRSRGDRPKTDASRPFNNSAKVRKPPIAHAAPAKTASNRIDTVATLKQSKAHRRAMSRRGSTDPPSMIPTPDNSPRRPRPVSLASTAAPRIEPKPSRPVRTLRGEACPGPQKPSPRDHARKLGKQLVADAGRRRRRVSVPRPTVPRSSSPSPPPPPSP